MFTVGFDTSALDIGFKAHAGRGIGRYVQELKKYFDARESQFIQIHEFDHRSFFHKSLSASLIDKIPVGRVTLKQQLLYPLSLARNGMGSCDVLHFPAHMDAPAWSPKEYILTVLDLIPLILEDLYRADRPGWRFSFARWLELRAIRRASLILAISECTARDVHRMLGVPRDRIVVTPLGVDEKFFSVSRSADCGALRAKLGIPQGRPVLLYVGGIDPRKNVPQLLRIFAEVRSARRELGQSLPVLVLSGKIQGDRRYPALQATVAHLGLETEVVMPGYVSDEDLLGLYGIASVFCFFSLYEGFGLPVLEAMAAGLPVVCSNTSSMPEVVGEASILVDPGSLTGCVEAILQVLDSSELSGSLRERGRAQARKFPWSKTGDLTVQAYEDFSRVRSIRKA